jgi:outer membrane beta-barrel protein
VKTTRQIAVWALVAGLMLLATPAHAQLEFGIENPRIFSIQPRPYRLAHEFQLGVGVMPLDAFYIGLTIGGSYTYHFSDFWAWEILSFHYSVNVDTSLEKSLFEEYGVIPVRGGGERTNLFATSALVVKPLFGKLALLNDVIVHAETFFTAGLGPFQSVSGTGESSYFDPAVMLGLGFRFWTFRWLSVRFEVRDYLVLKNMLVKQDDLTRQEEGLENQLMFELSAAFNFSLSDDDEKEAAFLAGDKGATP